MLFGIKKKSSLNLYEEYLINEDKDISFKIILNSTLNNKVLFNRYEVFNTNLKDLTKLKETDQLKYINKILDIQYGLKIKRCNQTSDKDNIMYKLDSGDRWNDLGFEIKPIELQLKQSYNQSHNIDTTNLDLFIDE